MAITFEEFKEFCSSLTGEQHAELVNIHRDALTTEQFDALALASAKKLSAKGLYKSNTEYLSKESPKEVVYASIEAHFSDGKVLCRTIMPLSVGPSTEEVGTNG